MNGYEEAKKSLAALGIDLDSLAKNKGEMPDIGVILDEVAKKFREKETDSVTEEKAKLYDGLKSKAIDTAIANGIKAKGEAFDENRYRKLFESSTIEEINSWAADFEAEAKKSIASGRTSEDSDKSMNTLAYGNLDGYKI